MKIGMLVVAVCLFGFGNVAGLELTATTRSRSQLEKRYNLKTVSCKTCHPITKDRSIHNKFGLLIEAQLKGKDMTRRFNEAEAAGEEAKVEFEKVMAKEFLVAPSKWSKKKSSTIKEMIGAADERNPVEQKD